jgi:hypothetical protein
MKIEIVEKKLREAAFFLEKMPDQERKAFGGGESFDFYLSAFPNAGMSFRGGFRVKQDRKSNAAIKDWCARWQTGLTSEENQLFEFMHADRVAEHHHAGSRRGVTIERVAVGNFYSEGSSTFLTSGPPGMSGVVIEKPAYSFVIAGREWKATDACAAYLALLDRMLAQYKADHNAEPIAPAGL